ncbi:hypothetical protein BT96DRAFT_1012388 [Gymnopus androsaceus JB14]|uniref:Uncharacterized protein n=1 Tax=Gymnopus androsaceus JB14 TaxID=1447944 RepID=A0A6A4IHM9_9AGAR|nr:hypothetical protein BT96DRAFT_1012388 [Gymnopus androsaceus JB14]
MSATAARLHLLTQIAASLQQPSPNGEHSSNTKIRNRSGNSQTAKLLNHLSALLGPPSMVAVTIGPLLHDHINSVVFRSPPHASASSPSTSLQMQSTAPPKLSYAKVAQKAAEVAEIAQKGPHLIKEVTNSLTNTTMMAGRR